MRKYFVIILLFALVNCNSKNTELDNLNKMEFNALKSQLPTIEWRKEMEEDLKDDDLSPEDVKFNEVILAKVDSILKNYILDMEPLVKTNVTEESIKKEVKKVVLALNDFDKIHPFIETGERKVLCEFIDKVITATGYKIPDEEDYTLEWREW